MLGTGSDLVSGIHDGKEKDPYYPTAPDRHSQSFQMTPPHLHGHHLALRVQKQEAAIGEETQLWRGTHLTTGLSTAAKRAKGCKRSVLDKT